MYSRDALQISILHELFEREDVKGEFPVSYEKILFEMLHISCVTWVHPMSTI